MTTTKSSQSLGAITMRFCNTNKNCMSFLHATTSTTIFYKSKKNDMTFLHLTTMATTLCISQKNSCIVLICDNNRKMLHNNTFIAIKSTNGNIWHYDIYGNNDESSQPSMLLYSSMFFCDSCMQAKKKWNINIKNIHINKNK